ncbi:ATP-dependent DNA helicase RecG [Ancylobacter dichloromethanicus]|uniref:ATP-dependent DNA helicase RecG n=1 Tax=Ancylobacter dichloromethanicus TaxID=518825 RepID=A0A9W6J960_9HYPH|nr:ATP-dependent DNA helicase RecG [Ancylobacter dichloromethanicus]MBS7554469.1 ATP-dependent DNA helicase RecG [Ancylobacter dichloromethanicus]GLK71599.1 ATP-dependent DNA helicase RecG [Ancylobacter dichloromethanicus]
MRPDILNPYFASITGLPGIGPKLARPFNRLLGREEGARLLDLLLHLPSSTIDRRARPTLAEIVPDTVVTVEIHVDRHVAPPRGSRAPYRVYGHDATGDLTLAFFKAERSWMERLLPIGETRWVSGTVTLYDGMAQMVHPDRVVDAAGLAKLPPIEPLYPLVEGLAHGHVRRAVEAALAQTGELPEWQASPPGIGFHEALRKVHQPHDTLDASPLGPAWQRLAYDELLAGQLALALLRARTVKQAGRPSLGTGAVSEEIVAALPFSLTGSQVEALRAIRADLGSQDRMLRLLQGDVGSGKTVVALLAAATVIEAGRQAALMAPTEILARQHMKTIAPLAEKAGLAVALLTGREKGRARAELLARLASGEIDLVIGTHALFQEGVDFRDLALAIVDEQHRFGVHQRLALAAKGEAVDVLVMTATPIPRTLVLTYFGDMDSSELREKPAGRKPIDTRAIPSDRIDEIVARLGRALVEGRRAYWICPLVEESENSDLAAAEARFADLRAHFGPLVGLVHGKMKGAEKDAAMAAFAAGETRLLVATTVVEVGVDVPEASIIVIEHAERFGLAQLHQLRGRVGRGDAASTCLLLYRRPLGEVARQRLEALRSSEDGFFLAEQDLKLRGEGDVLGTRQSGFPGFKLARLDVHGDLLLRARAEALETVKNDSDLVSPRGALLRLLLHIFERDVAVKLLSAG